MLKIAHIVNPFTPPADSELAVAQQITLETMEKARSYAEGIADITLFSAQYEEDRPIVPGSFRLTPDLDRSVAEVAPFAIPRRLPLIGDILDRLYDASDADYFIYTNIDIALMPHFYPAVIGYIEEGYDAFSITKRIISDRYSRPEDIPLMQAQTGHGHPGFDCFVFPRAVYPNYQLGHSCLGAPGVGFQFLWNLDLHGRRFKLFRDMHLTFHLGNDEPWRDSRYQDYSRHNYGELLKFIDWLQAEHGPIDKDHPQYRNLVISRSVIGAEPAFRVRWLRKLKRSTLKVLWRLTEAVKNIEIR